MAHSAGHLVRTACGVFLATATAHSALHAQTVLPPTASTVVTPSQLPSANPPLNRGQAKVNWDGHLLAIDATGESLSEVLAEITSRAGIRMNGYAPEDRIYGTYGPAPLVDVLSELVSGLPVNMLFVEHSGAQPAQLTFTARNGTATPPSPPSAQQQQYDRQRLAEQQPFQQPPPSQQPQFPANTAAGNPDIGTVPSSLTGDAAAQAGSNPESPNGVKTPQQIFEQLQRLRANAGAQKPQ